MSRNIKEIVGIGFIAFVIFLLPTIINSIFVENKTDTFYSRVDEDFNDCVRNANEELKEIRLCKEIRRASELAFNSASRVSYSYSNLSIFQVVLFVLAAIVFNSKRKVEDLERKLND